MLEDKDHQLARNIYSDTFECFRQWYGSHLEDPRARCEEDDENRCLWHCHEKDSSCRELKANKRGYKFYRSMPTLSAEEATARLFDESYYRNALQLAQNVFRPEH